MELRLRRYGYYIRENRSHSVIASLEVRLVETEDKYWATIGVGQSADR